MGPVEASSRHRAPRHVPVNLRFRGRLSRVRSSSPEHTTFRGLQTLSGAISTNPFFCFFCFKMLLFICFACAGLRLHGRLLQLWRAGAPLRSRLLTAEASSVAEHALWATLALVMWLMGSVVVARGVCCSMACGIFPNQGSNQCLLHCELGS